MWKNAALLFLIALLAGACAPFDSHDPGLAERVEQQDIQLRQMQPQQADAWNQIQAMRQEINELKGQLDDLNNAGGPKALAERVRQHDAALRQVDNNMSLDLQLGDPMTASARQPLVQASEGSQGIPTGTGAPDSSAYATMRAPASADASAAAANPVPMTGASSYGLPPDGTRVGATATEPVTAPSESTWGQADPQPQPALQTPKKDISLALFDAGVNSYNARDYGAAERSFDDFVKNYPNHSQIAEARYYLAECDFQRNRFPEAALAYETVIKQYPKSSSAPGAYLKQAICFSKMKQPAAARARMQEIISKFPNSPEAARARAFLKANK